MKPSTNPAEKSALIGIAAVIMAALFTLTPSSAWAQNVPAGLEYSVERNGNVEITKYTGNAASVSIPERIDGKPVTTIGDEAFKGCKNLKSITLPAGLTSIGNNAFRMCTGLVSIVVPTTLTSIGEGAFAMCMNLASINLPAGLASIGNYAFVLCSNLSSITLSRKTRVGENAFPDGARLTYRD